jgi:hypothetical protein
MDKTVRYKLHLNPTRREGKTKEKRTRRDIKNLTYNPKNPKLELHRATNTGRKQGANQINRKKAKATRNLSSEENLLFP